LAWRIDTTVRHRVRHPNSASVIRAPRGLTRSL
jgi:hypothetical protein